MMGQLEAMVDIILTLYLLIQTLKDSAQIDPNSHIKNITKRFFLLGKNNLFLAIVKWRKAEIIITNSIISHVKIGQIMFIGYLDKKKKSHHPKQVISAVGIQLDNFRMSEFFQSLKLIELSTIQVKIIMIDRIWFNASFSPKIYTEKITVNIKDELATGTTTHILPVHTDL